MRVFLALLSLAATAFAYQVTSPNSQESWYSHGPVTVSWQRVDTDAEYFTMVLYNDKYQTLQTLAPKVDGKLGKTTIYPSGALPVGEGYQVNFVQDPSHLHNILAQSSEFKIQPSKEHNYKRLLSSLPGLSGLGLPI